MKNKNLLRSDMRQRRDQFYASLNDAQKDTFKEQIKDIFFQHISVQETDIVSAYWPRGSEIDPGNLLESLLQRHIKVVLPRMHDETRVLSFHEWRREDLIENRYQILEPSQFAPILIPTLTLLPLLAFDLQGTRLGYGRGHYDATLAEIKKNQEITLIGLAYEMQKVDFIPPDAHDQRLNYVITEKTLYRIPNKE